MRKINLDELKLNNAKMSDDMLKEINGGCGLIRIEYYSCAGKSGYRYTYGENGCDDGCISENCIGYAIAEAERINLKNYKPCRGNFTIILENGNPTAKLIKNN